MCRQRRRRLVGPRQVVIGQPSAEWTQELSSLGCSKLQHHSVLEGALGGAAAANKSTKKHQRALCIAGLMFPFVTIGFPLFLSI